MSLMTTLQVPGPWTAADLERLPDDGHRYEIVDGVLLVNAAPAPDHQEVALRMWRLLDETAPPHLRVLAAPVDVVLGEDTVVEPDVIVARRDQFTAKDLRAAPVLAVEVLSPSTRLVDVNLKRARYERAEIASYWLIDPVELRLTVLELQDGQYVEVADVSDPDNWTATTPFEVTVAPGALLR
jgi:Uma2 family endonuclease